MFKLLITGLIIYFIYRFFIASPALDQPAQRENDKLRDSPRKEDEGEYIDYEEVE